METALPIIIIGAGPVGLSLATALIQKNIPVQVYEKCAELSPEARASTLHPRTLEMFDEWGIVDTVLDNGSQVHYLQFWERDTQQLIAQFDYDAIAKDTPFPFRLQCPQSVLTRVLKPHIDSSACGTVFMEHEFVGFDDYGTHVSVRFNTPDGEKIVEGRFLCGADGAHSQVREALGIEFEGMTYRDRFLLVATDIDFNPIYPELGPVCYLFDPEEWVIVLQLPDVTRIVFRVPEDADDEAVKELESVKKRIEKFTGSACEYTIHGISTYNVHQRVATNLRIGNVVLLGDSAHINNPMGGMGMNSGIHDAYHLANALEAIFAGEPDSLLDDYSDRRIYYARNHIQQSTDKNYRDMSSDDETYREKRNQSFRDIAASPSRCREYLIKRSMLDDRINLESETMNTVNAKSYGMWIDGQDILAAEQFAVYAPADGSLVGYAARANEADVDRAVQSAVKAAEKWAALPPAERELIMLRAADAIQDSADDILDLLIDESGSTITKARGEIRYSASLLRTAAGEARRLYGDTFPNDKNHRMSMVIREPVGVVAAISPFNAPLVLLVKMVVFALAVGNAVISKPSEETPLIALELAKILTKAGMPDGVFNVVTGYGAETGKALVEHPDVNGIAFTGSTATGIRIQQLAANTMKRLQLELGGKNPLLVLNDVDPVEAAEIAAAGAYVHGGQICMSSSRLIVESGVAEKFIKAMTEKAQSIHLGDLRDENTVYGPLINQNALKKVVSHVDAAVSAGATLLAGGQIHEGLTYQPTVLLEPPRDNIAWTEETFGPVMSIVVVDSLEEAIAVANESDYGLSAGVLTNDMQRGMQAARKIKCGAVHIGMHSFQSDALAPIGGYGLSGIGRSGGKYTVEHFTEIKWISLELGQ